MTTSTEGLEGRIAELESTIEEMRSGQAGTVPPSVAGESPRVGRRRLLRMAAAAVGGGLAAPILLAQTASANNGDPLLIGNTASLPGQSTTNNAAFSTVLLQTPDGPAPNGSNTHFSVKRDLNGANSNVVPTNAPLWGIGTSDEEGVLGYTPGPAGWGVVGGSDAGAGVVGISSTGFDFLAQGTGRLVQQSNFAAGAPGYSGGFYEQVRDNDGALYFNLGDGSVWAPALPGGANVGIFESVTGTQPSLTGNNGGTWVSLGNVHVTPTPTFRCDALCTANADLWTNTAGFNQDIAIFISGGSFGASPGTLIGWKESGGFAGTFSPNAAFVQCIVRGLQAGTTYTIGLYWKTNRNAPGVTIFAGAGPIGGVFSPTRLVVQLLPA